MSQLTLDLPKSRNGNGEHGRPDEHNLAADFKRWLADLDATEALRKEQLRQIGKLRSQVYCLAEAKGLRQRSVSRAS